MALSGGSRMPATAQKAGCTSTYTWGHVYSTILGLREAGKSLRRIAQEDFGGRVSFGVIQRILEGREPQEPEIREALGLPVYRQIVVVTGGEVPPGAQAISALRCSCGQYFIPNHPRRVRCFVCSPYRGG